MATENLSNIDTLINRLTKARDDGFTELVIVPPPDEGDAEYRIVGLDPWDIGLVPGVMAMSIQPTA
jgi:hypothetical protein